MTWSRSSAAANRPAALDQFAGVELGKLGGGGARLRLRPRRRVVAELMRGELTVEGRPCARRRRRTIWPRDLTCPGPRRRGRSNRRRAPYPRASSPAPALWRNGRTPASGSLRSATRCSRRGIRPRNRHYRHSTNSAARPCRRDRRCRRRAGGGRRSGARRPTPPDAPGCPGARGEVAPPLRSGRCGAPNARCRRPDPGPTAARRVHERAARIGVAGAADQREPRLRLGAIVRRHRRQHARAASPSRSQSRRSSRWMLSSGRMLALYRVQKSRSSAGVKSPSIHACRRAASPASVWPRAIMIAAWRALPSGLTGGNFANQAEATSSPSEARAISACRRRIFCPGQSGFCSIKTEISAKRPVAWSA